MVQLSQNVVLVLVINLAASISNTKARRGGGEPTSAVRRPLGADIDELCLAAPFDNAKE